VAVAQLDPLGDFFIMRTFTTLLPTAVLGVLLQGCSTSPGALPPDRTLSAADARVNFSDPVLINRQILLFGSIDQQAAEHTIQKLLFLDRTQHAPIDLYLQTPGGELKHAIAIEQIMRSLQSRVNTYALSECNSAGALLLAGGTGKRRVFQGAVIVIHGMAAHGKPPPRYKELIQDAYTHFWKTRCRLPDSWLPLPPGVLHVLSAEEALKYGVVDEVVAE